MPRSIKKDPIIQPTQSPTEPFSVQNFMQSFTPKFFIKIAGFLAIVLVAVFIFSLGLSLLNTARNKGSVSMPMVGFDGSFAVREEAYSSNGSLVGMEMGAPAILSTRNMGVNDMVTNSDMPYPYPPQTTGNTAEQFEVTDYNASLETGDIEETCSTVSELKSLAYVIFENANESTRHCSYSFKVEHAYVDEILAKIKTLDPKSLSENTYTIKSQLDDFTNQTEILEKKKASIEETLETALSAYDEITKLATKTQDAESLARIITSKVALIERLTQERININQQLDYLVRAKSDQLDRLKYTYFSVDISEKKYIDGEALSDSWYEATRQFVYSINYSLQNATLHLVQFSAMVIVYLVYLIILMVVAKFVWKFGLYMWKR